jgi:hypothetical protein
MKCDCCDYTLLERHVETSAVRKAKQLGLGVRKLNGQGFRSWPDRIFFGLGARVLFVEYKRPGGVPTPAQTKVHETLRALGFEVQVDDCRTRAVDRIAAFARNQKLSTDSLGSS